MNILAIETASEACSVALSTPEWNLERYELTPRGHAEQVLPWVEELLSSAGLALPQLDAIAFSRGPGSFTSLRIGISVVQGLAWGAEVPVVPLSSLQIAAQVAADTGAKAALVALDARMGEVFAGVFRCDDLGIMRPADSERVCPPEQAARLARPGLTGVGCGFARYAALSDCSGSLDDVLPDLWPRASVMAALARDWLGSNQALPAFQAQPVYLRDKVAKKQGAA